MSQEDIEATKAPMMEHLVELRSRLIKAVLAFGVMFGLCFIFAKDIYNVLVWPFVLVAGPEHSKFILYRAARIFRHSAQARDVRAAFLSFRWWPRSSTCSLRPALSPRAQGVLPYLIATPIFFALGALVVYFVVFPMLVRFSLHMHSRAARAAPRSS